MAIIDRALVALGYTYDDDGLQRFQRDMERVDNVITGFVTGLAAAVTGITAYTVASAKSSDAMLKQAQGIGIAVEELDALHHAATITMGDSNSLNASLEQFTVNISNAARGIGGAISAFSRLNVRTRDANGQMRSTTDVLMDVANNLDRVQNRAEQIAILEELGFSDPRSILLLEQGREGIQKLVAEAKELGVVTMEDAKAAAAFNDQWARTQRVLSRAGRTMATRFLPVLENLALRFQEFLIQNKELIDSGLEVVVDSISFAFDHLFEILTALVLINIGPFLAALKAGLVGLLVPFAAIIAKVALVIFILNELWVTLKGGDSALNELGQKIADTRFFDPFFAMIDNGIDKFNEFRETLSELNFFKLLEDKLRAIANLPVFKFILDRFSSDTVNALQNGAETLAATNGVQSTEQLAAGTVNTTNNNTRNVVNDNRVQNPQTVTIINNVTVEGNATDETVQKISDGLPGTSANLTTAKQ